jgi:Protein of unknown function (DUF642)
VVKLGSMSLSRPARLASLLIGLAVVQGACGGGGTSARGADGGTDATDSTVDAGAETAPDRPAAPDAANDEGADTAGAETASPPDAASDALDAAEGGPGDFPPVSACGAAGSLIANCSFEEPPAPAGNYQSFATGQSIGAWTVTAPGGLSTLSGTFTQNGYSFPAHDGAQSLDMTGYGINSTPGVSQVVATTAGARYDLTFWVGNLVDVGGIFGTTSTITVFVDGAMIATGTNSDGAGSKTLAWKAFTASFMATATTTTIELRNGDPSTDNSNILDDVTLLPAK